MKTKHKTLKEIEKIYKEKNSIDKLADFNGKHYKEKMVIKPFEQKNELMNQILDN